jgi:hypothetical protein
MEGNLFQFRSTRDMRESHQASNREEARQIIRAKNDAATQPAIRAMARP